MIINSSTSLREVKLKGNHFKRVALKLKGNHFKRNATEFPQEQDANYSWSVQNAYYAALKAKALECGNIE